MYVFNFGFTIYFLFREASVGRGGHVTSVYLYIYYSLPCITVEAPKNLPYDWVSTIAAVHNRSANNIFMHSSALLKPETMEMLIFPSLYLFFYFFILRQLVLDACIVILHGYFHWQVLKNQYLPSLLVTFFFFFIETVGLGRKLACVVLYRSSIHSWNYTVPRRK